MGFLSELIFGKPKRKRKRLRPKTVTTVDRTGRERKYTGPEWGPYSAGLRRQWRDGGLSEGQIKRGLAKAKRRYFEYR